jgi:hypothetical protein
MGYLAVWKVLEKMMIDFRKKGVSLPPDLISGFRSARTLINVLRADPDHHDTSRKVEEYLLDIESYLVSKGEEQFGREYIDEWLEKLSKAGEKLTEEDEMETRFIPGVPRDQKWIRVKPSEELPLEGMEMLVEELDLSCNIQPDGCLLVHGEEEGIKKFIGKITSKYGSRTAK